MERHHIVPKHCKGGDDDSNIILLSRKNHILAHYYRWISYDSSKDRIAYYFMVGDPTGEAKREAGKLAQKNRTFEKRSECSKRAYQTMLKRGSGMVSRGESWRKNVSKSAKIRIAENRMTRVTPETISLYGSKFEFKFGSRYLTLDQSKFNDFVETSRYLCSVLGLTIRESEHKKFILLVKGKRKVFHGITLNKVISSQAGDGLSFSGRFND